MHPHPFKAGHLLLLVLSLSGSGVYGAWSDATAGHPVVEVISAQQMGSGSSKMQIAQDTYGRLVIGADKLLIFDGQTWRSYATPQAATLNALALGQPGIIWVGGTNEVGYFEETSIGLLDYHSLVSFLPPQERNFGAVWGCAQVGKITFFICRNKVLRWDGTAMQLIPLPTQTRLGPLRLNGELWLHHLESGLYRFTEEGPHLEVPASELTNILILGLYRDDKGLVTVSNQGFIRPGAAAQPFSDPALNQHLSRYRVSTFAELPDGNLAIGTLSGGLVLARRTGELIRVWDSNHGLPGRGLLSLLPDKNHTLFGLTSADFFSLPFDGIATVFNARNGLAGKPVNHLEMWQSQLCAVTEDGTYLLNTTAASDGRFAPVPDLTEKYTHILPHHGGVLLSRFGGVDFFDGHVLRSIYRIPANWTNFLTPSRVSPDHFYAAEGTGLARLINQPDGSWLREPLVDLPDEASHLHEDPTGRLWIGTATRGAFSFDPATRELIPVNDPDTGSPFSGSVKIIGSEHRLLFFVEGRIFQAPQDGTGLQLLKGIPSFTPQLLHLAPNGSDVLVTIQHNRGAETQSFGLGELIFMEQGEARWREFDLPQANAIGTVRTVAFSQENNHPILWLGGTEGALRADYDRIATLAPPSPPTVRLSNLTKDFTLKGGTPAFDFDNHRVKLAVFAGDYAASKEWLIQIRLEHGEWSSLSNQRIFEFTNLSEGNYRFDARVVNSANMASEPTTLHFTILPPWYRSGEAYAGYVTTLLLALIGFIRVRDRRIRIRNQQLETLVAVRTEELVKANAAKDEFLASVSHEIRNPMNGVIGIAETFKTDSLDHEGQRKFALLRQCASHLASLLEDILDFSRIQAGAVDLESQPFKLRELVASIAAMTVMESEKRGIPVEIAISPAVPDQLTGDPRRIRQILLNFVSNALKFSGRGQVSVTVWCKTAGPQQVEIIFAISDEGPGISDEEQKKLFTRFERGAAAQRGRVPGTGLGLALCKGLAEKMGGRIWLESELDRGSCFYLSLTFASDPVTAPDPAVSPTGHHPRFKSALVVDDEEYNRISLADQLDALGVTVQTAADGLQALAFAELHDFDLIFLDYDLPGLSGVEVTRALRALPGPSAKAVIFATTAFTTQDKRAKCLAAGMNAFLGKPVTRDRLTKALSHASAATEPTNHPEPSQPADRLANLRLLASKKQVPFTDELALYLSELEVELDHLTAALAQQDAAQSGHYAHLLYGRCGFIYERELELTLRQVESAAATGQWEETQRLVSNLQVQFADLRVRLTASAPVVPPASGH